MRRFFLSAPLATEIIIDGDDFRHISKVLRMQAGEKCIVVDPAGQSAVASITNITSDKVYLGLTTIIEEDKEPSVKVILVQGLPKSDKMEFIIQKAVELGVYEIIPLAADRSVVKYSREKAASRIERWQKIAAEAAKQCQRSIIPQVMDIQDLDTVIAALQDKAEIIMLYEREISTSLSKILSSSKAGLIALLIGPEGGFSDEEVVLASQRGARVVTMGPRILRTETAAIAALSAVMYAYGDLGG